MGRLSRLRLWSRSPKPPEPRPATTATDPVDTDGEGRASSSPTPPIVTPSLWQRAYEQLDDDLVARFKDLLHQEAPSASDVQSESAPDGSGDPTRADVDRICQDGRRRMEEAEKTFRLNNEEHKVHDIFVKGLAVVTWAQGLVSTALDKASSPEASIAWAAAILVLPLFANLDTVREANKTGFTYVTASMEFYIALEAEFRGISPSVSPDLVGAIEQSIIDLYRNILVFQLQSAIRFNRNKFKNKVRDVFDYDGWASLLQGVKSAESLVTQRWELLQRTIGSGYLHDLKEEAARKFQILQKRLEELSNISQNTDKMVDILRRTERRALSREEQKHLQSLRHHDEKEDKSYELTKDRTEKRVEGTCKWLLANEQYQRWLEGDPGLLVISADPGCGKSVLSRYLIEEGLPQDDSTVCYFFFKDEDQDRVHLALCALLHQLLDRKPFLITAYLAPERVRNGNSFRTNVSVLWGILENALQDSRTGRVVIVLDGLDECKPLELYEFSKRLSSLMSEPSRHQRTRFIVTTRPYPEITSRLNAPHIRVAGELESETIRGEVKLAIQDRIQGLKKMPEIIPVSLLPHLEKKLLSVDNPTYLWVALTFRFIESGKFKKTGRGLNDAIDRLPRTIHEAYEKILRKTDPEDREMIRRVLTIVLGAAAPMSVWEMNVAVNFTPDVEKLEDMDLEDDDVFATNLRRLTGLFIIIDKNTVYFLHQTVREFLIGDGSRSAVENDQHDRWQGSFNTGEANRTLASICLRYLKIYNTTPVENNSFGQGMPWQFDDFLEYVQDHHREHLTDDIGDELLNMAMDVLTYPDEFGPLALSDPPKSCIGNDLTLLLAAWNHFTVVVKHLVALPNVHIECSDAKGRTPLALALGWEYIDRHGRETALVLLGAGADPNPELAKGLDAPLVTASIEREDLLVRTLVEKGAAVDNEALNMNSWHPDSTFTALHYAATSGRLDMIESLVHFGADINARTVFGKTPLHLALRDGWSGGTYEFLLTFREDIDDVQKSLIHAAALKDLVKVLIRCGADVNTGDIQGLTPLHDAVRGAWEDIVRLLIFHDADVNARDENGLTPLHVTANNDLGDIARLLIAHGADVDVRNDMGWTPLHEAASMNSKDVAALLLSLGVDVAAADSQGATPLMFAEMNGAMEVRDLMLAALSSEKVVAEA